MLHNPHNHPHMKMLLVAADVHNTVHVLVMASTTRCYHNSYAILRLVTLVLYKKCFTVRYSPMYKHQSCIDIETKLNML